MTENDTIPEKEAQKPKTRQRTSPLKDAVTEIKESKKKIGLIYWTTFLEKEPEKPRQINVWWNIEELGRLRRLMKMKQAAGILGYATVSDAIKNAILSDLKQVSYVDRSAADILEDAKRRGVDMRVLISAAQKEDKNKVEEK
jgi:hypothetical protein